MAFFRSRHLIIDITVRIIHYPLSIIHYHLRVLFESDRGYSQTLMAKYNYD